MEDTSSDSDIELLTSMEAGAAFVCTLQSSSDTASKYRDGSTPGRSGNRNLNVLEKCVQLDKDLFCRYRSGSPLFTESEFERTYRMPRTIYEKIRQDMITEYKFFRQNTDAAGRKGGSTDLKLFAAYQMINEGRTAFSLVKECRMSESQIMLCTKTFVKCIVEFYEGEWLRRPNEEELIEIEKHYRTLGFPGCIGAVDCAGWEWENCPVAWKGLFTGKEGRPSLRMEVISDDKLRIWHLNFGMPGSKNDKTIMHFSNIMNDIRNKLWPEVLPKFTICDYNVESFYFLADGIYPKFMFFALPHPDPRTRKEKMYSDYHSSARKAIERVFGVLFRQFRILYNRCRLENVEEIQEVVKACCIIHNMVAVERGYEGTMQFKKELEEEENDIELERVVRPECRYEQARMWREEFIDAENREEHRWFTKALVENIWSREGEA